MTAAPPVPPIVPAGRGLALTLSAGERAGIVDVLIFPARV
jgi:hypothetical protein